MTGKRFSDLPAAQPLSGSEIFAVTQTIEGVRVSVQVTVEDLVNLGGGGGSGQTVRHVKSGETLDALTAEKGFYLFDAGSVLKSGPGVIPGGEEADFFEIAGARLEVIEAGWVARLSALVKRAEGDTHTFMSWELYSDTAKNDYWWNETSNLLAWKEWTISGI